MDLIKMTKDPLVLPDWCQRFTFADDCGAFLWFDGKVRNHHEGKNVAGITYEAFSEMANSEMKLIVGEIRQQWKIKHFLAVHRVGQLQVGESSILVGVASAHRADAFFAAQYFIEELKKRVPIWKKEHYVDGAERWHDAR